MAPDTQDTPINEAETTRNTRLGDTLTGQKSYNPYHSGFVRSLRFILPIIALSLITIVFTWTSKDDKNLVPVTPQEKAPRSIGQNELVNPRFESLNEAGNPYTITAARALQGESNEDLVILEKPVADITMNSGNWIALKAKSGAYRQDTQRLLLNGDVELFHDLGYTLTSAQLNMDLVQGRAWSDVDVYVQGPAGTIDAKGMKADNKIGHLLFNGPATLVLNRTFPIKGENN